MALKHDQIAYFDLENFKSITVNKNATSGGVVKEESMVTDKEKPQLNLMGGTRITGEHIAKLYKNLTGKVMTPEEIADATKSLDVR